MKSDRGNCLENCVCGISPNENLMTSKLVSISTFQLSSVCWESKTSQKNPFGSWFPSTRLFFWTLWLRYMRPTSWWLTLLLLYVANISQDLNASNLELCFFMLKFLLQHLHLINRKYLTSKLWIAWHSSTYISQWFLVLLGYIIILQFT